MTNTSSIASKLFVGFVVASMLFTLSYTPAKAATAAELQAQIDALLAQIAGMTGGSSSSSCTQFTMDLTMGASGAEVTALQKFLIGKGHTIAAGATGYFGGQTQAALSAFQSANGISPAAGYFGPVTRAKVNGMCTTTGGDDNSDDEDNNDDDSSSSDDLSGEADYSASKSDLKDGDDTNVEEGQEDAPVADLEVEFKDGDAKITRIDVDLSATGEEDAWDTFDEISLWVDGEEVAREDASDEDNYLDTTDGNGSIRFSGLDIVAMEDESVTITIGASIQGSVDNLAATWNVDVTGMRFMDADDVSTTLDNSDLDLDATDFEIDVEGADDEVIVKSSSEDPDATTIAVDETTKSDWTTIFAFDVDTDDSTNDIEVNTLKVGVVTNTDEVDDVVSDIQLVIDGETYDDVTWSNSNNASSTATFDIDGDLVIDAGDRVTVEVQVEFNKLTGNYDEGDTIFATTTGASGDFEGADDVTGEGAATGETHTLRTQGAILEAGDTTETIKANTDSTTADDEGVFTIKFDVTAFESDLFVAKTGARGTSISGGVNYTIEDSNGAVTTSGTTTASLTSTADTENSLFKVAEGETETFTLTVNYDPATAGFYQLQLYSFNFDNDSADATPSDQQLAVPAEDYETDALSI
jgi:peptidoglycan hydrolase-like protein with peptidoglycan-binding domain